MHLKDLAKNIEITINSFELSDYLIIDKLLHELSQGAAR